MKVTFYQMKNRIMNKKLRTDLIRLHVHIFAVDMHWILHMIPGKQPLVNIFIFYVTLSPLVFAD